MKQSQAEIDPLKGTANSLSDAALIRRAIRPSLLFLKDTPTPSTITVTPQSAQRLLSLESGKLILPCIILLVYGILRLLFGNLDVVIKALTWVVLIGAVTSPLITFAVDIAILATVGAKYLPAWKTILITCISNVPILYAGIVIIVVGVFPLCLEQSFLALGIFAISFPLAYAIIKATRVIQTFYSIVYAQAYERSRSRQPYQNQ